MAMKISMAEAKNNLTQLVKAVESGEQVTICRHGLPVADIVRTKAASGRKPKLGTMRDRIKIIDPDWWKPMSEEEADRFLEGKY